MENPTYIDTSKFTPLAYPDWKTHFYAALEEMVNSETISEKDASDIQLLFRDMENDARFITDLVANQEEAAHIIHSEVILDRCGNLASYLILNTGLALNMMNILRTIDLDCKAFGVDHPLGLPNSLRELVWLAVKITTDRAIAVSEFIIEEPQLTDRQKKYIDKKLETIKKTHSLPDHRPITVKRQIRDAQENGLLDIN